MALLCVWMFTSIFGTVVEGREMSTKDMFERKKYVDVCRWEAEIVARIMSRFPGRVMTQLGRKSSNAKSYRSVSSGNPSSHHLPDSPGPTCSHPLARGRTETTAAGLTALGGSLTAVAPLQPFTGEQPEDLRLKINACICPHGVLYWKSEDCTVVFISV